MANVGSSFKQGFSPSPSNPSVQELARVQRDAYDGKFVERHKGVSDEEKFGLAARKLQNPPLPMKNVRSFGNT